MAIEIDSLFAATPVGRRRYYMPGVSYAALEELGSRETEYYSLMASFVNRFTTGLDMQHPEELLFTDEHPCAQAHLTAMEREKPEPDVPPAGSKTEKWPAHHCEEFNKQGLDWTQLHPWPNELCLLFPGLRSFTSRAREIVQSKVKDYPKKNLRMIDASQGPGYGDIMSDAFGCAAPGMAVYLTTKCRRVLGAEALTNFQKIHYREAHDWVLENHSDQFLADLAGNAMHKGNFIHVHMAQLCTLAVLKRKFQDQKQPIRVLFRFQSDCSHPSEDGEKHEDVDLAEVWGLPDAEIDPS